MYSAHGLTDLLHRAANSPLKNVYHVLSLYTVSNKLLHGVGKDTLIEGCHIYGIGCSAMSISGGDRVTLTPGNVTVRNNKIHDWALVSRSYLLHAISLLHTCTIVL